MSSETSSDEFSINSAAPQFSKEQLMAPRISLEEILGVQSLVMGFLRQRARTRKSDQENRRQIFVMRDSDSQVTGPSEVYDGAIDTYLGCSVHKVDYDQWTMLISFMTNICDLAHRNEIEREIYHFDWLKNGNRMAWAYVVNIRQLEEGGSRKDTHDIHPVESDEIRQMKSRMHDISERVNPLQPGSFMGLNR